MLTCKKNRVHDATEPEITKELWGSGEVNQKRRRIRELIENLHLESYFSEKDRQQHQQQEQQQEAKDNEKETEKVRQVQREAAAAAAERRRKEEVTVAGRRDTAKGMKDVVEID